MSPAIEPAWEYWQPDPEVAEAMGPDRLDGFAALGVEDLRLRRDRLPGGFRFGRGDPDFARLRLAPPRPGRARELIPRKTCPTCGKTWQPDRSDRRYCSMACRKVPGRPRELPGARDCGTCGATFRPLWSAHRFCSRRCANRSAPHPPVSADVALLARLYAAGVSMRDICAAVGAGRSWCRKLLKRLGQPMRPPGRPRKGCAT